MKFEKRVSGAVLTLMLLTSAVLPAGMFPQSVASGDPNPIGVVLWTRAVTPDGGYPDAVTLEMALDADFQNVVLTREFEVDEAYDGVVKVWISDLSWLTTYYYRFTAENGGVLETSPVGRTKTAPSGEMRADVKFAVVYSQDYVGRYFNTYLKLLMEHDEDIDFVLHLGNYIAETTGDPFVQDPEPDRAIEFGDLEGAIPLGDPDDPYYAAASLENYRTIYKYYRSDPILQEVHERWPMLVMWNDREFSDDRWQDASTYSNGRVDEHQPDRLRNAERAFLEWIPTVAGTSGDGLLGIDPYSLWPYSGNWKSLLFGRNLHLLLSDTRTYRPDHLIPEDAFPGTITVDEAGARMVVAEPQWQQVRGCLDPYVDMDLLGSLFPIMKQTASFIIARAYMAEDPSLDIVEAVCLAEKALRENVSASYMNALYESADLAPPFDDAFLATLPRGISNFSMGKTAMYSSTGSRYNVNWDPFNIYAAYRWITTAGEAQDVFGEVQSSWLHGSLLSGFADWTVLASAVMLTPLLVDFTNPEIAAMLPPGFPDERRTRLGVTMDQFDGFPQKKLQVFDVMSTAPNNIAIVSGDINSTFVTDHQGGLFEFTAPSVSAATIQEKFGRRILADPVLGEIPGIETLVENLAEMLRISTLDDTVTSSDIAEARTDTVGFSVIEVTQDALHVTIWEMPASEVETCYYHNPDALEDLFTSTSYTVRNGELTRGE